MTKIEELKAALAAATPGEWDFVIADNAEPPSSMVVDYCGEELLTHRYGVTGRAQHDVQFIALAHNLMPTLLDAVELLEDVSVARARQDHEFDVDAWYIKVRALLEKLK